MHVICSITSCASLVVQTQNNFQMEVLWRPIIAASLSLFMFCVVFFCELKWNDGLQAVIKLSKMHNYSESFCKTSTGCWTLEKHCKTLSPTSNILLCKAFFLLLAKLVSAEGLRQSKIEFQSERLSNSNAQNSFQRIKAKSKIFEFYNRLKLFFLKLFNLKHKSIERYLTS